MSNEELARYADAIVAVALGVREGDEVIVNADLEYRELAVAAADAAYRAGARHAEVLYADERVQAVQIRSSPEAFLGWQTPWRATYMRWRERPEVAAVNLLGDGDPQALAGLDPERLSLHATGMSRFLPWTRTPRSGRRRRWIYAVVAICWVLLQGSPPIGSTASDVIASLPSQLASIAIAVIAAWPRPRASAT